MIIETTVKFRHIDCIDLHELLCKAVHEQDEDAIIDLTNHVSNIELVGSK